MAPASSRARNVRNEAFEAQRGRRLAADLPAALATTEQFFLVYQPRIRIADQKCVSVEALLRWRHPEFGLVSPADFIPLAEKTGEMRRLTSKVIAMALGDLADWSRRGHAIGVSINVSGSTLSEEGFVESLLEAIASRSIAPERIELEFTEDVLIEDTPAIREALEKLVDAGVGLAIDDFGAGNSNLNYLRELPTDTLKIDRAFVRELAANDRDQIIVRSIISLAHALGYLVVAEGVENAEALNMLASWGCDEAQGFFIGEPAPLADLFAWLDARDGSRE